VEVVVVDEPSLHLHRNASYVDARAEKNTRGTPQSSYSGPWALDLRLYTLDLRPYTLYPGPNTPYHRPWTSDSIP